MLPHGIFYRQTNSFVEPCTLGALGPLFQPVSFDLGFAEQHFLAPRIRYTRAWRRRPRKQFGGYDTFAWEYDCFSSKASLSPFSGDYDVGSRVSRL